MNSKIWIPVAIVVVAAGAFFLGQNYRIVSVQPQQVAEADENPGEPPAPPEPPAPAQSAAPTQPAERPSPPPPPAPRRAEPRPPVEPARPATPRTPAETPAPPEPVREEAPPPPPPEPVSVRLPEGTRVLFALDETLNTKTTRTGDSFTGTVIEAVEVDGNIAIPKGTVVHGTVAHSKRAGRIRGRAELNLRFDRLELPDGQTFDLSASLAQIDPTEKETVGDEGSVEGEGTKSRDAKTVGAGAGIGAVIGAITGGGKGAAAGGGVGAGAGAAAVLLTRGRDVELDQGSRLAIELDRALTVRVP